MNSVRAVLIARDPQLYSRDELIAAAETLEAPPALGRNGRPLMSAAHYDRQRAIATKLRGLAEQRT